jgi:SH3-like domain-containing protein
MASMLLSGRLLCAVVIIGLGCAAVPVPSAAQSATDQPPGTQLGASGLPVPRFVSLKSNRVNVRAGPGEDHRVLWIFTKEGLPIEIIAEFDNWRRIRDSEGAEGWVYHSLLSGRRTALIAPWSKEDTLALHRSAADDAAPAALVEPGVLVDLNVCDGTWCRVTVNEVTGWIRQDALWGVYPKETLK